MYNESLNKKEIKKTHAGLTMLAFISVWVTCMQIGGSLHNDYSQTYTSVGQDETELDTGLAKR